MRCVAPAWRTTDEWRRAARSQDGAGALSGSGGGLGGFLRSSGGALRGAHQSAPLVAPLVVDLNGDGSKEVLVATAGASLALLSPPGSATAVDADGAAGGSAPRANVLRTVSLLPKGVRVAAGRTPVAMASGVLEDPEGDTRGAGIAGSNGTAAGRGRRVVAVLTANWLLVLLDHNLDVLWEASLADVFGRGRAREAAVLVTSHSVQAGDRGMVVVAGAGDVRGFADGGDDLGLEDAVDKELFAEREGDKRAFGETLDDRPLKEGERAHHRRERSAGGSEPRGARYVALEGGSGTRRWTALSHGPGAAHGGADAHAALHAELHDQHSYKLDAQSTERADFHAASCRPFRESVLRGATPHAWARRTDTRLALAHFGEGRRGRTSNAHNAAAGRMRDRLGGAAQAIGETADALGMHRHGGGGAEARDAHARAHERVSAGGAGVRGALRDNALVAHLSEGIEAINLYTGETICSLLLPSPGLHADLDGDGVLDHVTAIGALHGSGAHVAQPSARGHEPRACWAHAATGALREHPMFDGSICKLGGGLDRGLGSKASHRQFGRAGDPLAPLEVAPPVAVPHGHARHRRHRAVDGAGGRGLRARADAAFLNSRGEVTAFATDGTRRWQVRTDVAWRNEMLPSGVPGSRIVPTLELMPLRWDAAGSAHAAHAARDAAQAGGSVDYAGPAVLLAAGEYSAALLSASSGRREQTFALPAPPAMPLVLCDFDGDGYTDILLVGEHAVYGLVQQRHPGAILFSVLLGGLFVAMALIYVTQDVSSPDAPRATDDDE